MNRFLYFLFLISGCSLANNHTTFIEYNLSVTSENPEIGMFSADTSDLKSIVLLKPRHLSPGSPVKVSCVTNRSKSIISYGKQYQCDHIEWGVSFIQASGLDADASTQKNLHYDSKWWVLYEWNAIPRIQGHSSTKVCVSTSKESNQTICHDLPESNEPPLIAIWGDESLKYQASGVHFKLFTDSEGKEMLDGKALDKWKAQYDYLSSLFPAQNKTNQNINIAWLGIDKKRSVIGGAAGKNAFVSNYAIDNGVIEQSDRERLAWVSGHEAFHMITPYHYPLWISESLAQYYGYKSFARLGSSSITPIQDWNAQQNRIPGRDSGLYLAHEKVLNNDMSYYSLFYFKGAAFWYELDALLSTKGHTLDRYLALLSNSEHQNGRLSREFKTAIAQIIGEQRFKQLISKYL